MTRRRGTAVATILLVAAAALVLAAMSTRDPRPHHTVPAPCTFSERGIPSPSCGPLVGAAYGSNSDPSGWEKQLGRPLGVRRTYWGPSQVDDAVAVARADVAARRIPWISFKVPYSWEEM